MSGCGRLMCSPCRKCDQTLQSTPAIDPAGSARTSTVRVRLRSTGKAQETMVCVVDGHTGAEQPIEGIKSVKFELSHGPGGRPRLVLVVDVDLVELELLPEDVVVIPVRTPEPEIPF